MISDRIRSCPFFYFIGQNITKNITFLDEKNTTLKLEKQY